MNKDVLVLDAAYMPLGVISPRRAVVLALMDLAEIVAEGEGECRSPSISVPWPEVVRLNWMVKVPDRARIPVNKRNVLARDNGRCAYRRSNPDECEGKASSVDHVRPRSRGGRHRWDNVVASCSPCNSRKDNALLTEIGWESANDPYVPRGALWFALAHTPLPSWEPYLAAA
jgi:5-methylcytosine-specific restriction endonuclease McrA